MRVEDYSKLSEPFPESDIEWRLARSGKKGNGEVWGQVLAYITSRAVQQRLDDVCGADGWQTEIIPTGNGAYLCKLSVKFDYYDKDGNYLRSEWITRVDGSDESNIEAVKGGISGSVKRAAVQFGIGRYLYNLKDNWAVVSKNGKYSGEVKDKDTGKKEWFKWDPPKLPAWALPNGTKTKSEPKAELSPAAEKERNAEVEKLIEKAKYYLSLGNIIPDIKIETVNNAIKDYDFKVLSSIVGWCDKQVAEKVEGEL